MKTMIIYDLIFGNTEQIARTIGKALGADQEVEILSVGDATPEQLAGLNLLIVGSPTRQFRPTPAISQFLERIPANSLQGVNVAAFDTRISLNDIQSSIGRFFVRAGSYAARPIAEKLKKKRGNLAPDPEGFYVKGEKGPLKDGELERSATWARQIIAAVPVK